MSKRQLPRVIQKPVTVIGYPPSNGVTSSSYTSHNRNPHAYARINNPHKKQRNIQNEGYMYWDDGAKLAAAATTPEGIKDFEDYIRILDKILPCDVCKEHFKEFKRKTPFEEYKYLKDDTCKYIGCFVWWFILHNSVNERIGKPLMQFEDAYFMYYDEEIKPCKDCGI